MNRAFSTNRRSVDDQQQHQQRSYQQEIPSPKTQVSQSREIKSLFLNNVQFQSQNSRDLQSSSSLPDLKIGGIGKQRQVSLFSQQQQSDKNTIISTKRLQRSAASNAISAQKEKIKVKDALANLYKNMISPNNASIMDNINKLRRNGSETDSTLFKQNRTERLPQLSNQFMTKLKQIDSEQNREDQIFASFSSKGPRDNTFIDQNSSKAYVTEPRQVIQEQSSFQINDQSLFSTSIPLKGNDSPRHQYNVLTQVILSDDDKKRMKRKFKTLIMLRYITEGQDLFKLLDNKPEWYKNCMQSSFDQAGNKAEKILYHSFIEDIVEGKMQLTELLDQKTLDNLSKGHYFKGSFVSGSTVQLVSEMTHDEMNVLQDPNAVRAHLNHRDYNYLFNENYRKHVEKMIVRELKKQNIANKPEQYSDLNLTSPREIKTVMQEYFNERGQFSSMSQDGLNEWIKTNNQKSTILFILFQELVRQVSQKEKTQGFLLLKVFKEYFTLNEQMWNEIIKGLKEYIEKMRNEREYLLGKFKQTGPLDAKEVLKQNDVTLENLIEHKAVIEKLIGDFYDQEDRHYNENFKRKYFEKEVYDLVYDWDKIRISEKVKKNLMEVDTATIVESLKFSDEYRNMKKDQLAILVNAQRFLLSLKKQNPWEGEIKYYKAKNKELQQRIDEMKQKIFYIEESHREDQIQLVSKEDQILHLNRTIHHTTHMIKYSDYKNVEVQTLIDLKNMEFIDNADKFYASKIGEQESKIQRVMRKISFNLSKEKAMNYQETLELIQVVFAKRVQAKQHRKSYQYNLKFSDFVYTIFTNRFQIKKKVDKKCEQFLLALNLYHIDDERIDTFEKFIGLTEAQHYSNDILDFYVRLIIALEMSVVEIFGEDTSKKELAFVHALEKYFIVFRNMTNALRLQMIKSIVSQCSIALNGQPIGKKLTINQRFEMFIVSEINRCMENNDTITILLQRCRDLNIMIFPFTDQSMISKEDLKVLLQSFLSADSNQIFVDNVNYEDFFQQYFAQYLKKNTNMVIINRAQIVFNEHIKFSLNIRDFLNQGLTFSIRHFDDLKQYYKKIFEEFDEDKNGTIDFEEFTQLINKLDQNLQHWKVIAMYQSITQREKDYMQYKIKFEQFLSAACNNDLMEGLIDTLKNNIEQADKKENELPKQ